jgi:hypothetical protein
MFKFELHRAFGKIRRHRGFSSVCSWLFRGIEIRPHRRSHRQRSLEGEWHKGVTQIQAIGRSRGSLTAKFMKFRSIATEIQQNLRSFRANPNLAAAII